MTVDRSIAFKDLMIKQESIDDLKSKRVKTKHLLNIQDYLSSVIKNRIIIINTLSRMYVDALLPFGQFLCYKHLAITFTIIISYICNIYINNNESIKIISERPQSYSLAIDGTVYQSYQISTRMTLNKMVKTMVCYGCSSPER